MKPDDEQQSGLAKVDKTAAPIQPRRSTPMKVATERPSVDQLTPQTVTDVGASKIKAELASALEPVFEEIEKSEQSAAAMVVSNLMPRAIAARSAQSGDRIAANVKAIAAEVGAESLETFPAVDSSNTVLLLSVADTLLGELFPSQLAA